MAAAKRATDNNTPTRTSSKPQPRGPHAIAFGEVLKDVRSEQGITQEQLGWQSGIDRKFIGALERGIKEPCLDTILKITRVLNIPLGDFMAAVEVRLPKRRRRS
jgi:transcriptional regulator with XRE-family HTH domain